MMSDTSSVLLVETPIFVSPELGLDETGFLKLSTYVSVGNGDDVVQIDTDFDAVVEDIMDFYQYENGAKTILKIANKLYRYADSLSSMAAHMNGDDSYEYDTLEDWPFESDAFDTDYYDQLDR
jgi:hypothetical protein